MVFIKDVLTFNEMNRALSIMGNDWLKEYAVKVTMKEFFKLKSDHSLRIFMEQFKSCLRILSDTVCSSIFRKAIKKCVKLNYADVYIALCKSRFKIFKKGNDICEENDCIFAYTAAVSETKVKFIAKICQEKISKEQGFDLPEVHILVDIILEKEAWDMLFSVFSNLAGYFEGNLFETVQRCLCKMLSDRSTWSSIGPAFDLLLRQNEDHYLMKFTYSELDPCSVSVSSLKQWCVDNGYAHLALFLAVMTEDWPVVETVVNKLTSEDLQLSVLGQSLVLVLAVNSLAFSTGAALLKVSPNMKDVHDRFFHEMPGRMKIRLAKECEDQGLTDWAVLLRSGEAHYVQEHHKHCLHPFVLNTVLKQMAKAKEWNLVRELLPRSDDPSVLNSVLENMSEAGQWNLVRELLPGCDDSSKLQHVLKEAVKAGQVKIVEALMDRVDPNVVDQGAISNKTLFSLAAESEFVTKQVEVSLVHLFISAGLSTFQRDIPFHWNKRTGDHNCPLLMGLCCDNLTTVKLMLACGAYTHKRLDRLRQDSLMQRCLQSYTKDEAMKTGCRWIMEAAATPCRLEHMARLVVSHSIGCQPGRLERIDSLPVPQPLKDLVGFKDVLSMDTSSCEPQSVPDLTRSSDWTSALILRKNCGCEDLETTNNREKLTPNAPMENLYKAIASGNCTSYDVELMCIINDPSMVNEVCSKGLTPLCLACKMNRGDLVPLLLQRGARTDVTSLYLKRFPLHYASDHSDGNVEMVNLLLACGAQPNVQDEDGNTPLHLACTESNVPVAKALLDAGSDVELKDLDDETPLVRACFAKSVELVDLLLKAGSDPNYPQGRPLEIVVRAPSVESLKLLIGAGARVTANSYLSFASEHNCLDMMKVLHDYGADVNTKGRLGLTALHHACISQEATYDAVTLLLSWGSDPNITTNTGDTALHLACQTFSLEKVRLLLTYGANINQVDGTRTPPIVTALTTQTQPDSDETYLTMIQLLLAAGAKLSSSTVERIKILMAYVQNACGVKDKLVDMLTRHTSEPESLQHMCRVALRRQLAGNIDQKISSLPLPKAIINFVQFGDIPRCGYRQ